MARGTTCYSLPHGAGRTMTRSDALKRIDPKVRACNDSRALGFGIIWRAGVFTHMERLSWGCVYVWEGVCMCGRVCVRVCACVCL